MERQASASSEAPVITNCFGSNYSLPFTKARVNHKNVDCLLDSGAAVSLVRCDFLTKDSKISTDDVWCVRNATGSPMSIVGKIELSVGLLGEVYSHWFYVARDLVVPVIIGVDFLAKYSLKLEFINGNIQVGRLQLSKPMADQAGTSVKETSTVASIFSTAEKNKFHGLAIMCNTASEEDLILREIAIPNCSSTTVEFPTEVSPELMNILEEFNMVFSTKPGTAHNRCHEIPTVDDIPVKIPPRRIPTAYREEVRRQIQEMLDNGIITPSSSSYMAPCVLVPKKSGEIRICVDYRELNKKTIKNAYPLPLADEIQEAIQGATIFSTLDLRSGYWQIPVAEADRRKTAFCPGHDLGLFEFQRMPFGLVSAPATFQAMMNDVLRGLDYVHVYIDDILIHSTSLEEHKQHIRTVLGRLRDAGLTIRGSKCSFGKQEVQYLGHIYNGSGMTPDPKKVSAVLEWPTPKSVKELQGFLGLTNYYRRFIYNYAETAAPLYDSLRNETTFQWNPQFEEIFKSLKKLLCEAPILQYPNWSQPLTVSTDASNCAIGAVLEQQDRVIAYASRVLKPSEKNYSVIEKECLALVFAFKQFRHFLMGRKFQVFTDHRPLQWLSTKIENARICRWSLLLQEFDFEIQFRPGRKNSAADALSRKVCDTPTCVVQCDSPVEAVEIKIGQAEDPIIAKVLQGKLTNLKPQRELSRYREGKAFLNDWKEFLVRDGMLMKKWYVLDGTAAKSTQLIPVIGSQLRQKILRLYHDEPSAGHNGADKTYARLRTEVYWPYMRTDVLNHCKQCAPCQQAKLQSVKPPLKNIPIGKPWSTVAVDILEVPISKQGNRYLIVYQDYFTKWPEVYCCKNQTAETVEKSLHDFISRFGPPERIHSDLGPNFESRLVKEVLAFYGVQKSHTTPYHPQGNGMVERFNRSLLRLLRTFVEDEDDWERFLAPLLYAYRTSKHSTTGFSPFEILFSRDPKPLVSNLNNNWGYGLEDWRRLSKQKYEIVSKKVEEHAEKLQQQQKRQYDKTVGREEELNIGDEVWLKNVRKISKLSPNWNRGWIIIKSMSDQNVVIQREDGSQQKVVNRARIRKVNKKSSGTEDYSMRRISLSSDEESHSQVQATNVAEMPTTTNVEEQELTDPSHNGQEQNPQNTRPQRFRRQPNRFMFEFFE